MMKWVTVDTGHVKMLRLSVAGRAVATIQRSLVQQPERQYTAWCLFWEGRRYYATEAQARVEVRQAVSDFLITGYQELQNS